MKRRTFLKASGAATIISMMPRGLRAATTTSRCRPTDVAWPFPTAWKQLNETIGGNLVPVDFPVSILQKDPDSDAAKQLWKNLKNPYFIGDTPGLTETLGWVDAWDTKPSAYAVAARNARDIAAAVKFACDNNLRLVVKGGGHSYQGTSNAPDSLLIWTRHLHDIQMHEAFVPQGCENMKPQLAVTLGAGTIWMQAYQAVTTRGGKYVQGGGCTSVGVAGLIQSGGFGSHSKHFGTAAAGLLEADVVTADGQIRIANAGNNPDLFWALNCGGGGTYGVISKVTLRVHDLPEYFGVANFKVQASSGDAYRRLISQFVSFYAENLFNDHWGEQPRFRPDNVFEVSMVSQGFDRAEANKIWKPFLDWVKSSLNDYSFQGHVSIGTLPAQRYWDVDWWKEHWVEMGIPNSGTLSGLLDRVLVDLIPEPVFNFDDRPGATPSNAWWRGHADQCGWYLWAMESLWLPASLLEKNSRQTLADALFASSRHWAIELHLNKGLAGAPPDVIAAARDTATNPAVLDAFALAIVANAQGAAYPGIPDHEPRVVSGRVARKRVDQCVDQLRAVTGATGAYWSESNYFEKNWQQAYWGSNHARLAQVKTKYDPDGLFFVHNGVGSEQWSRDGFTKYEKRLDIPQDVSRVNELELGEPRLLAHDDSAGEAAC